METESEPYIRLATLRQLHQVVAELNTGRSLAETLQTVADGVIQGLGYELSAVNLVRPDGDLVVAAVSGSPGAEALMAGRVGSRTSWERRLSMGERWGDLRFIPYTEGWVLDDDDVPQWHVAGPAPRFPDEWHPMDRLFAPMRAAGSPHGELLGVISVDKPRNGRRPGAWGREALQMYAFHSAIAIGNARLRANMQRALMRLERDQQALRASEESFRQAFEYAPSGMAIAEMGGDQHGRLLRTNDALCRLLGRSATALRRYSFSDLVHPEDIGTLLRTSAEGGRAELRLVRRDGTYMWVSLRNSVVADAADGPRFLLTHVEDIEERKRHELQLAHRASHDSLTGLPNSAELRTRLGARLCARPPQPAYAGAESAGVGPDGAYQAGAAVREAALVGSVEQDAYVQGFGLDGFDSAVDLGGLGGFAGLDADALEGLTGGSDGGPFDHHVHTYAPAEGEEDDGTKGLAVLFCDLDGFKSINDRFGHHTGDAVLIEVARRLSHGVRDGDTVARLGGDEFVVLADGLGRADAQDLAVRLRNAIIPPIRFEGRAVRVGASFGISWAACGMSAEEVLQSADQRMYVEKRSRSKANRRAG
ncbi:diguanylate cyclase CdgB [Streptomyces buecherae]|uniref:diguanylate cyclase CdgB n=2 Tax=Streptomyces buecherae TaxID=2763006 RepID=UPI00164E3346|nr:diguanylate cyclase CdgB [Streptomyces buecherae]MBC3984216.1 diguanylate cyclase [Streptomyces buecherae]MBC3990012.1 diguanylate cyclase [Streptomyces buecherae]QNJ41797.1 diguanylate cyclase [Streptomyces buecherae]